MRSVALLYADSNRGNVDNRNASNTNVGMALLLNKINRKYGEKTTILYQNRN